MVNKHHLFEGNTTMRQARTSKRKSQLLRPRGGHRSAWLFGAAFALSCAVASSASGVERRVDASAPPNGDGTSWPTAFKYLQDGFAAAVPGDDIWVAQGTYRPDQSESNPGWLNDPNKSFNLKPDVRVFGGFPAGGGNGEFSARNPEVYITTLSGDIGVPGNAGDNSFHVVTAQNIFDPNPQPKLNGFWIRYGNAGTGAGGGMRISDASPQVVRCTFDSNQAARGGAVVADGSVPLFVNCGFLNNTVTENGGAMYVTLATVTCHNCLFDSNHALDTLVYGEGGAIFVTCGIVAAQLELLNAPSAGTRPGVTEGRSRGLCASR